MSFRFYIISLSLSLLWGCGGGSNGSAPSVPSTPIPSSQDFTQIAAELERFDVDNVSLIIGDASGEVFRVSKGNIQPDTVLNIASASKLYTGLGVWSLVEAGQLDPQANPQDHIQGWATDPDDLRSQITLDELLSFRSGFNSPPVSFSCSGNTSIPLQDCVTALFDGGLDSVPGNQFAYGPDHMQIAALMVRDAAGVELSEALRQNIWDPVGASADTGFPTDADNSRYSGAMQSTGEDYGKVLTAFMDGSLFSDRAGFLADRTGDLTGGASLGALDDAGLDWHYGYGFWIECSSFPFEASCNTNPRISSPGAFGFVPWVDLEFGYWAVLAMEEPIARQPSRLAVEFQQVLLPMIEAQFD
ncbi:MAG: serine hydrolase [Litorimonas sp.]